MIKYLLAITAIFLCLLPAEANIVKGNVRSAEDEGLIIGADVSAAIDSVQILTARTDNSGSFSLTLPEKAQLCNITISSAGYEPHTLSISNLSGDVDLGRTYLSPVTTTLDELDVAASSSRVISLPDKSIIFPTQLERDRATNPLDLLAQISYAAPALSVDRQAKSISIDGRTPQILINGVRRGYSELNAINPADILKVEYITYPDIRYSAPYINIVTMRKPTGGSFLADFTAPVTTRQENHQIYAAYSRGCQEVAVNYRGSLRDSRKEYTDLSEQYFAPDRTYVTELRGLPSRLTDRVHEPTVEYSLTGGPKKMLVTTASLVYHSQDQRLEQVASGLGNPFRRTTVQDSRTLTPSLNIYGSLPVASAGRLEMDITYAYESGHYLRSMAQSDGYKEDTDIKSQSYSLGEEVNYEHYLPWSKITARLTHRHSHASNLYAVGDNDNHTTLDRHRTAFSASLSGQIAEILYYYASAGMTYSRVDEGCTSPFAYLMLQKRMKAFSLSYDMSASSSSQGLGSYSDVVLPVNEILYRTGNPLLKDPISVQNRLYATYSYRKFSTGLSASFISGRNIPITICSYMDQITNPLYGKFLETTGNSRRGNTFSSTLSMGLYNVRGHYSLRLDGSYANMSTQGHGHKWHHDCLNASLSAAAYFGPWQFGAALNPFPSYSLYGNMLWRQPSSWGLQASWHRGEWTVGCHIADLFTRKASYQERTIMAIGYLSQSASWNADKNNWVAISVRYQINFGRQPEKPNRNVSGDTRVDSGVNINY